MHSKLKKSIFGSDNTFYEDLNVEVILKSIVRSNDTCHEDQNNKRVIYKKEMKDEESSMRMHNTTKRRMKCECASWRDIAFRIGLWVIIHLMSGFLFSHD